MKKFIKILSFILLFIILFLGGQEVLTPDWDQGEHVDRIIGGMEYLDDETVDVIFLGTSHMEYGVSPVLLYKNEGICSYNLSTSAQPIELSYYLLKQSLKSQHPQAIVMDVGALFRQTDYDYNFAWRYVFDCVYNHDIGITKWQLAKEYDELWYGDGWLSVYFPIIKYHTRWNNLNKYDFRYGGNKEYYTLGYFVNTDIVPNTGISLDDINQTAETIEANNYMSDKNTGIRDRHSCALKSTEQKINSQSMEYLLKIKALCDEYGMQLILTKIPTMSYPQEYSGAWTVLKYEVVKAIAKKYDISYIDLMFDLDIGLEWETDSADGGRHLNLLGAQKASQALGEYLINNLLIESKSNDKFDQYTLLYEKMLEVALLETEVDFYDYLKLLEYNSDKWTILIGASDDFISGMDDDSYAALEILGLKLPRTASYRDSYIAVIEEGMVKYEYNSEQGINYHVENGNLSADIFSSGWYAGRKCEIIVDNQDISQNQTGLNIVVIDNETNLPIDSVAFNTFLKEKPASRGTVNIETFFRTYEAEICFGQDMK